MERTLAHRNGKIAVVSDQLCRFPSDLESLPIPPEITATADELVKSWEVWRGKIILKDAPKPTNQLKLAVICNWGTSCGIAEYSKNLVHELQTHFEDTMIFAETDSMAGDGGFKVSRCWTRGKPIDGLMVELKKFAPDVVLIQHEYGIFPNARVWLSLMTQLRKYKTVVTLHSVFKSHHDKDVCELSCPHIIVHNHLTKDVLKEKSFGDSKISVIPHGSLPLDNGPRTWNMYRSDRTFVQFGFGFKYKGWETSLALAKEAKARFADAYFTGIFTESPFNRALHEQYFNELLDLVDTLEIPSHVGLIRTPFLDDATLMRIIRMSKVAVFPYIDNGTSSVYAASGAARTALRAGLPTLVSSVPLFEDLEGVCPRAKNLSELMDNLAYAWSTPSWIKEQLARQHKFLQATAWPVVAKQYADVLSR